MRHAPLVALTLFASIAAGTPCARGANPPTTVKVDITEGADGTQVKLNLPLAAAEAALAMAPLDELRGTTIRVGDRDVKIAELRDIWKQAKKAGDSEVVRVQDAGDDVRISMRGDKLLVRVEEKGGSTVSVDVPHAIVDALLSGRGEQLDFAAALAALRRLGPGEIVRVDGGAEKIRISLE